MSWEQVVKADPQCIIINDYGTPTAAQKEQFLETSPITKNLTAVKNHCFLPLSLRRGDAGPPQRRGRRRHRPLAAPRRVRAARRRFVNDLVPGNPVQRRPGRRRHDDWVLRVARLWRPRPAPRSAEKRPESVSFGLQLRLRCPPHHARGDRPPRDHFTILRDGLACHRQTLANTTLRCSRKVHRIGRLGEVPIHPQGARYIRTDTS